MVSASMGKSCGILRDQGRTSVVQQLKCGSAIGRTEVSCTGLFHSAHGILWQKSLRYLFQLFVD